LLRQGAKLVENAQDVLEELPVYSSSLLQQPEPVKTAQVTDSKQQALLKAMGHDPQSLEMLLLSSELELEDALLAVQALIDMGRVAQMPGGLYQQLC
jgi:DNA processing protein